MHKIDHEVLGRVMEEMRKREEIAARKREMNDYVPEYSFYSKLDSLTLVEFVLVQNEIDPKIFNQSELSCLFVDGVFKPISFLQTYNPRFFMRALNVAFDNYTLLKRVPWARKYKDCYDETSNAIAIDALIKESQVKKLEIPQPFIDSYEEHRLESQKSSLVNGCRTSQATRAENNLHKIIAALAKLNYPDTEFNETIPKMCDEIEQTTQRFGCGVGKITIRKALDVAAQYIPATKTSKKT